MAMISVAECFSSPQAPGVISERLVVKVKPERTDLTVLDLKKAIVQKGHSKLSDVTRMTLILPIGRGILLRDDMRSSQLEDEASVLVLMSLSKRETNYLHAAGGLNIPHILFVYHTNEFKSYMRWPQSITSDNAGKWITWTTPWSASLSDLAHQFTAIGFSTDLVARELYRLEHRKLPIHLGSSSKRDAGAYAPNLLFRLWDAVGYNSVTNKERRQGRIAHDDRSECESFGAPSIVSICTASTVVPSRTSTSAPPPLVITSVPMACPSEHESAYDEEFYQAFTPPAILVSGRAQEIYQPHTIAATDRNFPDCTSFDSSDIDSVEEAMARNAASGLPSKLSNQDSLISRVGESHTRRDESASNSHQIAQDGGLSREDAHKLERRKKEIELERIRMKEELDNCNTTIACLSKQLESETTKVDESFQAFEEIRNKYDETAERNIETIKLISEILTNIVTCSICAEKYGSFADNQIKRSIQLLCGHNFCVRCLSVDWRQRSIYGMDPPFRCFYECAHFDPECTAEVPLMDEIKDILSLLSDSGVVDGIMEPSSLSPSQVRECY